MKQNFFSKGKHKAVEKKIKNFLNKQKDLLSVSTANSPRAVGDAIQEILEDNFDKFIGSDGKNFNSSFARRAMADLAFEDKDGNYYIIDVKTHRLDTKFNMPNLTSVERLSRFYEDDKNNFTLLLISYGIKNDAIVVKDVHFTPIENLNWECLTIGALGWGQIQIANSNHTVIDRKITRKSNFNLIKDTKEKKNRKDGVRIRSRITFA